MEYAIFRADAAQDFSDPAACPLATVLRRHGHKQPVCGTIEVTVRDGGLIQRMWVSGVYLNGQKIDHPAMGLGPVEIQKIRQAFEKDPSSRASVTLVELN